MNSLLQGEYMPSFEEFMDLYGKKVGKKLARRSWDKLSFVEHNLIMIQLPERLLTDKQWLAGYQPHPATYLNQELWEDEYETSGPDNKQPGSESIVDILSRA